MIHPLYEPLPCSVLVHEKMYPVVTDFHSWIAFFDMLQDESYTPQERMACAMTWYLARPPCDIAAAYDALVQFASCNDLPHTGRNPKNCIKKELVLSYRYDAAYMISDFLRFYHIDLTESHMHWYKFRMLLEALPDESSVKQRAAYRSINVAEIKDKEQRKRIRKVKDAIWIPRDKKMSAGEIGAAFG